MGRVLVLAAALVVAACSPTQSPSLLDEVTGRDYVAHAIPAYRLKAELVVAPEDIDLSIDRRVFLRDVFDRVVTGDTHQARVESWVRFLQNRIAHSAHPPMHPDGVMLTDPVWILRNRVAHCGQTNRVLIDGLTAAGYRARAVQLTSHVAAEVFYDDNWHFIDADWLNNGQFIRRPDGTLPSTAEIFEHPEYLAGLDTNSEFRDYPADVGYRNYQAYADMFRRVDLGNGILTPYYMTKIAGPEAERDLTFGWNFYQVETQ